MNADSVDVVRSFNRLWTAKIGALGTSHLETGYSLTEARVLFELAHAPSVEVAELRARLDLDAGYMSRILARFSAQKLTAIESSTVDARRRVARLTAKGRKAFQVLEERAILAASSMLKALPDVERRRLLDSLRTVREIFQPSPKPAAPYVIRALRPGDLGWVVQRHGALYAKEYGWDQSFEALVARIVADYVEHHDPRREDAWIAEVNGEPVGCVFCVKKDAKTAQLRILLVDPSARGMGIGARLVDECVAFARRAGYARITLWTNSVLVSARRIYEGAGFELASEERHRSFGHDLVGQNWTLDLRAE